ncbi:hypothetical protein LBMAG53_20040 [Planctomycetota bacterium]|nr:hypothetical protein LBMAG53_20040 [Planctomycetota bacterium]
MFACFTAFFTMLAFAAWCAFIMLCLWSIVALTIRQAVRDEFRNQDERRRRLRNATEDRKDSAA